MSQLKVRVSFVFVPDDPDPADKTGCSEEEYDQLMDRLLELGAENVSVSKVT